MVQSRLQSIALLIPGIAIPYSKPIEQFRDNPIFQTNCEKAGMDYIRDLDISILRDYGQFLQDNLDNQKLSYVVNCSMCDIYKERGIVPEFIVGYSMGLYTALYAAGYYSFETGLRIVEKAFHLTKDICSSKQKKYGVALILGLTEKEIRELLFKEVGEGMEIAIYNGMRSFVIVGEEEKFEICLKKASEVGALGVKRILTEHPYHTPFLKDISHDFYQFMNNLHYSTPVSKVLSLIDGKIIGKGEAHHAVVKAMYTPLHFDLVIDTLLHQHNISVFYESGPHESMRKLVKYIDRKAVVHHLADGERQ